MALICETNAKNCVPKIPNSISGILMLFCQFHWMERSLMSYQNSGYMVHSEVLSSHSCVETLIWGREGDVETCKLTSSMQLSRPGSDPARCGLARCSTYLFWLLPWTWCKPCPWSYQSYTAAFGLWGVSSSKTPVQPPSRTLWISRLVKAHCIIN